MILIIDNYDSFTFNLYQYITEFSEAKIYRNDEISIDEIIKLNPSGIVISPGPGRPEDAGITVELIKRLGPHIPILGICLGHQAIGIAYGGEVIRAKNIMHGKKSNIRIKGKDIFDNISRRIDVMRYHSLIINKENIPSELEVIGESLDDGEIMAVKHKVYDVYGVQFHPESVYTKDGKEMIRNFVEGVCRVDN